MLSSLFLFSDDRGYYNQTLTESEANSWSDVEDERSRSRSREPEQNTKVGWHIDQGSKGIRQWSINWCTSQMMIHKLPFLWITISGHFNHSKKPTNRNVIKVPKVIYPTNKKRFYKTLGTAQCPLPPWKHATLAY